MRPTRRCLLPSLQTAFKSAMARVSSQAMILTAGARNSNEPLHGMTLSSVCSLSVYPKPLLQFNLHLPSYTSASLHQNGGFLGLHVMPPSAKSVMLGRKFASGIKRDPEHFEVRPDDGEPFHEMTTPFTDIPNEYTMHEAKSGLKVPVLTELEVSFICKRREVFTVDDHEIWVVLVDEILFPNKNEPSGGLLYFDRGFHSVGKPLKE